MDGFSGYNQNNILPKDHHKTAFIFSWVTFSYRKLPFGLKNAGANFQHAMSYDFHDINHIMQPYLVDLPTHSIHRQDHPTHLQAIFIRCRYYPIRLNPPKCVFYVESDRILGSIVSIHEIRVDPLKVEAILNLPPPSTLHQLQSLQGKEKNLRRFIPNYTELMKGFTQILKKGYTIKFEHFCDEVETNFHQHRVIFLTKMIFFLQNSFVGLAATHGSSSV
jgi:hypothetical protein